MLRAYTALGIGALGLGFSAIFVRWAGAPGAVTGFYRMAIALVVLAPLFGRELRLNGRPPAGLAAMAFLAGLFFTGDLAAWNTSVLMTNAANATLLANTAPIWVGLGTLLILRRPLSQAFWVGLGLALFGTALISGADFLRHPVLAGRGDLLALLAGFFYGGFYLATGEARQGLSSLVTFWIAALASTVSLLVLALLFGNALTGYGAVTYWNFLALGLVTQVAGYLAINYALGHLPADIVAATLLLQPVLTALLAIPLLAEGLSAAQLVGGAAVLGGIWVVHGGLRPRSLRPGA